MTIREAQQQLTGHLQAIYDPREAAQIADWVMEHLTGRKKIDRLLERDAPLLPEAGSTLKTFTEELLGHRPVQYVLHEAWFYGLRLYVDENVLIPRPETEELVEWILRDLSRPPASKAPVGMLDIGTGSGCIPVALKKQWPAAEMTACDISEKALQVARRNAAETGAAIRFFQVDFLDPQQRMLLPASDILVSNPPYIPLKDRETMRENVLQYEPALALFVDNEDPLLFYRALADFARTKLLPGGCLYAEIHEEMGNDIRQFFAEKGYVQVEIKKDLQGRDRMLKVGGLKH